MTTSTLWQMGPDGTCTYPVPLSQHVRPESLILEGMTRNVPLSRHARPAFTHRGTCRVCGLTDVVGTTNRVYRHGDVAVSYDSHRVSDSMSCALCVMTGRA